MAKVIIDNINLGGLADSQYLGPQGSVAAMAGLDIHGKPGLIRVNQKLTKDSGSTIDAKVNCMVQCSDGSTYLFGDSGKVWKRTSGGTYSLERTAVPGTGSANITGAYEDQGKIYYFMQNKVGRWAVGSAWSTANDTWATFTVGDDTYHPAVDQNLIVYIGDGKLIAQIEDDVFTGNALDIKAGTRVRSVERLVSELLIGSFIADSVLWSDIFRWNTWSESFSSSDPVPEAGVHAFIPTDNFVLAIAGHKGRIYVYSNDRLERFMRIPGDWDLGNKATVNFWATVNMNGLPLFGLSNVNGNPASQGMYSLGSYGPNYPGVLNLEFPISAGLTSVEVTSVVMAGDVLLVAWKSGSTYGVDKLDSSAKYASSFLESRVITIDRQNSNRYAQVTVAYKSLPAGTGVAIKSKVNHAASFSSAISQVVDTDRKIIKTTVGIEEAVTLQIRIEPTVSGNDAPEIERIEIDTAQQ